MTPERTLVSFLLLLAFLAGTAFARVWNAVELETGPKAIEEPAAVASEPGPAMRKEGMRESYYGRTPLIDGQTWAFTNDDMSEWLYVVYSDGGFSCKVTP